MSKPKKKPGINWPMVAATAMADLIAGLILILIELLLGLR